MFLCFHYGHFICVRISYIIIPQSAPVGERSCDQFVCVSVRLSASISLEPLGRSSRNFVCGSPVAVAWSSSDGAAIRYVLPVLRMPSRFAVMGRTAKRGRLNL